MSRAAINHNKAFLLTCTWIAIVLVTTCRASIAAAPSFQVRLDRGHPWRPPFGLDRVGQPIAVVIESSAASRVREVHRHRILQRRGD